MYVAVQTIHIFIIAFNNFAFSFIMIELIKIDQNMANMIMISHVNRNFWPTFGKFSAV